MSAFKVFGFFLFLSLGARPSLGLNYSGTAEVSDSCSPRYSGSYQVSADVDIVDLNFKLKITSLIMNDKKAKNLQNDPNIFGRTVEGKMDLEGRNASGDSVVKLGSKTVEYKLAASLSVDRSQIYTYAYILSRPYPAAAQKKGLCDVVLTTTSPLLLE